MELKQSGAGISEEGMEVGDGCISHMLLQSYCNFNCAIQHRLTLLTILLHLVHSGPHMLDATESMVVITLGMAMILSRFVELRSFESGYELSDYLNEEAPKIMHTIFNAQEGSSGCGASMPWSAAVWALLSSVMWVGARLQQVSRRACAGDRISGRGGQELYDPSLAPEGTRGSPVGLEPGTWCNH